MAPLPLGFCRFVPLVKSSRWKVFHFFCLVSAFFAWSVLPALAAAPPTGENAYCVKGHVAQFGAKDAIPELPLTCYYTALDVTPSPGKQIRVSAKRDIPAPNERSSYRATRLRSPG